MATALQQVQAMPPQTGTTQPLLQQYNPGSFTLSPPQASTSSGGMKLPLFEVFDGAMRDPAAEWLTAVKRYWQFNMQDQRGKEVLFTLSRMKGNAANWYASALAPVYGEDGSHCPADVFAQAFTARYITPHQQMHVAEQFEKLRQDGQDARTYNERFNAVMQKLAQLPGHGAL